MPSNYARERIQGRDLEAGKDPDALPVPIIRHPDVRRMLLQMKAYVDGHAQFCALCRDNASKKKPWRPRMMNRKIVLQGDCNDLLTPPGEGLLRPAGL